MIFQKILQCRVCNNKNLFKYLDLGKQPLANSFLTKSNIPKEKKFPLEMLFCSKCYLSQLSVVVNPKYIFSDYDYLSSSSRALQTHYKDLCNFIIKKYKIRGSDVIIDIGCNDGILLNQYPNSCKNLVGVEPSNASKFVTNKKIALYSDFFNKKTSDKIIKRFSKAKIVTMTNVLARRVVPTG